MRQLYAFVVNESTHNKNHIINTIFVYWLFHYYFPVSFFRSYMYVTVHYQQAFCSLFLWDYRFNFHYVV